MKEKIKEYLLVVSIVYGFVIVLFMTVTYFNMETYIEFEKNNDFYTKVDSYKKEVNLISNQVCKTELNNYLGFIEKHNLEGKVVLKDYFNTAIIGEEGILDYYGKIKKACSLSDESVKENGLPSMFLAATLENDEILQKYMYQSELHLKDYNLRLIAMPSLLRHENDIKTGNELNIIRTVLEMINDGGRANEN